MHQRGIDLVVAHEDKGLPLVEGAALVGIGGLDVIHRGQITVATVVVDGHGRALVVGGRVGTVERIGHHLRVGREVQAQLNHRGLLGFAGGLLGNGQHHPFVHIGAAGGVHRRRHQALTGRIDHIELLIEHERAVAGVDVLQTVGRLQWEKAVTGDRQVQRVR